MNKRDAGVIIFELQKALYNRLNTLSNDVKCVVYLALSNDITYPCVLVNILSMNHYLINKINFYYIKFEICAYSREQYKLTKIFVNILNLITRDFLQIRNYFLISLKDQETIWHSGRDLLTKKVSINYGLKLREEVSDTIS